VDLGCCLGAIVGSLFVNLFYGRTLTVGEAICMEVREHMETQYFPLSLAVNLKLLQKRGSIFKGLIKLGGEYLSGVLM
jgi:hypothetical protein